MTERGALPSAAAVNMLLARQNLATCRTCQRRGRFDGQRARCPLLPGGLLIHPAGRTLMAMCPQAILWASGRFDYRHNTRIASTQV